MILRSPASVTAQRANSVIVAPSTSLALSVVIQNGQGGVKTEIRTAHMFQRHRWHPCALQRRAGQVGIHHEQVRDLAVRFFVGG